MTSTGQPKTAVRDRPQVSVLACPLLLPHYIDTGSAFVHPHCTYHSLGHCLCTNIFPGAPLVWKSLVKESYNGQPLPARPTDPQRWYGRRTEDMDFFFHSEMDRKKHWNHKLNKAPKEMENKGSK